MYISCVFLINISKLYRMTQLLTRDYWKITRLPINRRSILRLLLLFWKLSWTINKSCHMLNRKAVQKRWKRDPPTSTHNQQWIGSYVFIIVIHVWKSFWRGFGILTILTERKLIFKQQRIMKEKSMTLMKSFTGIACLSLFHL